MGIYISVLLLSAIGIFDSLYLTYKHYHYLIPPCSVHVWFTDCGKVLRSEYAVVLGIPVALLGVLYYAAIFLTLLTLLIREQKKAKYILLVLSAIGFAVSIFFVIVQLLIIKAICLYCIASALLCTSLFFIFQANFAHERRQLLLGFIAFIYKNFIRKIFFRVDPELIHRRIMLLGERLGSKSSVVHIIGSIYKTNNLMVHQTFYGISFRNPVGLAAGFDYEGRLTRLLPALDFGFHTVGTVTNLPCKGNPRPTLGRLIKSRSLMVNKGFKNLGAAITSEKLRSFSFEIPLGISIGRTNTKQMQTQTESVEDIIKSFTTFENSSVRHSYYELNISCPNLYGNVSFYPPNNLKELLNEVESLRIERPVFIKMPIEKSDKEVLQMLDIIQRFSIQGVILGNLQKDRSNKAFIRSEVEKFKVGNFSGKPTFDRSNELIQLTYRRYKGRFIIIGCGGVFSADDAYKKITLGASLVQLITGLVFEGPQLVAQINEGLVDLLKKDGLTHISQAIGLRNL